jgi:hypothetical protein
LLYHLTKRPNEEIVTEKLLLRFRVLGRSPAPIAEFIELYLAGNKLLILGAPVVYTLALAAGELYKPVL